MQPEAIVMVSPHNWYDHVLPNKINRPLKLAEQLYNLEFFKKTLIVCRIHPNRVIRITDDSRKLITRGFIYNLFYDWKNKIFYLEHCLPFGFVEELLLPKLIKKIAKKLKINKYVLWISDPKSAGLLKRINTINIVDAYDDWSLSPLFKQKKRHMKYIIRGYEIIKYNANIIITNTVHMKNKLNFRDNVYIVNNTSSLVNNYFDINVTSLPFKGKVVGYVGNLHERIDIDLLEYLFHKFPDTNFVFVGKNEFKSNYFNNLISKYSNVLLCDPVSYNKVSSYIKNFDVCIVPHIVNEYTMSQDSMKIYDYLSLGKPIVTTKIPPADLLTDYLYVAESHEEFAIKLKEALEEDDVELLNKRIEYMKRNTWRNKMEFIYSLIQKYYLVNEKSIKYN